MSPTRMSIEEYDKVTTWMRANKERIETTGHTQLETAAFASAALGFKVPLSTIKRCAKMANVTWAKSPPKPLPVPLKHEAILILITALEGLYVETGRTVPENLANLHTVYVKEKPDVRTMASPDNRQPEKV